MIETFHSVVILGVIFFMVWITNEHIDTVRDEILKAIKDQHNPNA